MKLIDLKAGSDVDLRQILLGNHLFRQDTPNRLSCTASASPQQ